MPHCGCDTACGLLRCMPMVYDGRWLYDGYTVADGRAYLAAKRERDGVRTAASDLHTECVRAWPVESHCVCARARVGLHGSLCVLACACACVRPCVRVCVCVCVCVWVWLWGRACG